MNKQEAIDKIRNISTLKINNRVSHHQIDMVIKNQVLDIISQIDESKKVVVPQFVANWIETHKRCMPFLSHLFTDNLDEELKEWLAFSDNQNLMAKAWLYGYEVEKEKLYTVKFANENFGKMYIGILLPLNDDEVKLWFTEDELKRFKFWDNPAFEVEEVEE